MKKLTLDEVIELLKDFANENGLWAHLKEFLEEKGYSLSEFGIED